MSTADYGQTRRRFVKLSGLAGATTLAGCTGGISGGDSGSNGSGSGEWPMFQYDAKNTGNASVVAPDGKPSEQWHFETGSAIRSPPVIKDGTAYFNTGDVHATSLSDGTQEWSVETADTQSIAVTDEHLLRVAEERLDPELFVHALDDSVELARYHTPGHESAALAMSDEIIYVASNAPLRNHGGPDSERIENLYAVTADGGVQWTFEPDRDVAMEGSGGTVPRQLSPVVADERVFVATNSPHGNDTENLYALSGNDGGQQWSTTIPDQPIAPISVADDTLYLPRRAGDGAELHALSTDDGSERWSVEMDRPEISSVAVADGTVYVACDRYNAPDGSAVVRALSTDDGSETWTYEVGGHLVGPPVIVGDTVYASGTDRPFRERGDVYAVAASDGSERWHYETDRHVGTSPVIVDGTIYLGSKRGNVYALR